MPSAVQPDLGQAASIAPSVAGALSSTRIDSMIASQLNQIPGLDAIYKQVIDHAAVANEAVGEILGAVDLPRTLSSAQGQPAGGQTVDTAALSAGVAKLGKALAITSLVDKIEAVLGDPQVKAALKQKTSQAHLAIDSAGVAAARGALKSVNPDTVGLSVKLRSVMAHMQQDAKASSMGVQQALTQAEAAITQSVDEFDKQIVRFVGLVDGLIATTFN